MGMSKAVAEDVFGSEAEPTMTVYRHDTVVIKDGRGGVCRFDKSEVNDLIAELGSILPHDAPAVKLVDLTNVTAE